MCDVKRSGTNPELSLLAVAARYARDRMTRRFAPTLLIIAARYARDIMTRRFTPQVTTNVGAKRRR